MKTAWMMNEKILFYNHLSTRLYDRAMRKLGDAKVLLYHFHPNMTNLIQPIDAGLGRSIRLYIGHALDD